MKNKSGQLKSTPETDAKAEEVGMGHFMVDSDFSRKLERERDEAREELKKIAEYGTEEINAAVELRQKLASALIERDELRSECKALWVMVDTEKKKTYTALRERDEAREALDRASLYISNFTGSCPYDLFDIEPHDSPCSEVCDKYANDMHLCWKKHFANKEAAK